MGYDANNAVEGQDKSQLPEDTILNGVIVEVNDGKVKDFIGETVNWKGDKENPAINVAIDVKVEGEEEPVRIEQLFTYFLNDDGKTVFTPRSNLGKYKAKYGKLPEKGDQLKVITNSSGFGKVKVD